MGAMSGGGTLTLADEGQLNPCSARWTRRRRCAHHGRGAQSIDEGQRHRAAARARIFDPFFSTKDHGLGLGLASATDLEQHRGAIHVDSEEGRGTTVTCFLPTAR